MWPMLLELLPHFTRLLPMADKYLSTRTASEKAQEAALAALGVAISGRLGELGEVHAGIQRQLLEQGEQLAEAAVEVTRVQASVEGVEARVAGLEKTAAAAMRLLVVVLAGLACAIGLLVVVLVRLRGR
jgi:CHASE3 domain sensor protein